MKKHLIKISLVATPKATIDKRPCDKSFLLTKQLQVDREPQQKNQAERMEVGERR